MENIIMNNSNTTGVCKCITNNRKDKKTYRHREANNAKTTINYTLIKTLDKYTECDDPLFSEVYSLLVVKTTMDMGVTHKFIYDISRQKSKAEKIFNLIKKYKISPDNLLDIIEDLI